MKLVEIAKKAVEKYILSGKKLELSKTPTDNPKTTSGVFVTIKNSDRLRGCIGVIDSENDLKDDIIDCAISSSDDPRFPRIKEKELPDLNYEVTVIESLFPSQSKKWDPQKLGVLVKSKKKTGVLLPGLEGVDSSQKQVEIALNKAGIRDRENYEIFNFKAIKYE